MEKGNCLGKYNNMHLHLETDYLKQNFAIDYEGMNLLRMAIMTRSALAKFYSLNFHIFLDSCQILLQISAYICKYMHISTEFRFLQI